MSGSAMDLSTSDRLIMVHVAYPHRWGQGKVHIAAGPYRDTLCRSFVHGERRWRYSGQVTCKVCLRIRDSNRMVET